MSIPSGVEVSVREGVMQVKGEKTTLTQAIHPLARVELQDGQAVVHRASDDKAARAAHGLVRSLLANMVTGVTEGFTRGLDIVGVGYRAEVSGRTVKLLVGYSHPVEVTVPEGIEVSAEGPTRLVVKGADKQQVGQFAADLRAIRPPEPYKGKGIRYVDERIRRKVGKAGAGG